MNQDEQFLEDIGAFNTSNKESYVIIPLFVTLFSGLIFSLNMFVESLMKLTC